MKNVRIIISAIIFLLSVLLLQACARPAENLPENPMDNLAEISVESGVEAPVIDEPLLEEEDTALSAEADEPEPEITLPRFIPESGLVDFFTEDGLTVSADLYKTADEDAPYILLFHQADSSRGEYHEIAPRLNVLGFNCLAIDQRSGDSCNDITNNTATAARKIGLDTSYAESWFDLKAALLYAKEDLQAQKIIIWGSSYSAALAFVLASEFPEDISAIVAFSPGEYFDFEGIKLINYAANVVCPLFVAAEANIENQARGFYNNTPVDYKAYCKIKGHGSSVLWNNNAENEQYWQQVVSFLSNLWSTARF